MFKHHGCCNGNRLFALWSDFYSIKRLFWCYFKKPARKSNWVYGNFYAKKLVLYIFDVVNYKLCNQDKILMTKEKTKYFLKRLGLRGSPTAGEQVFYSFVFEGSILSLFSKTSFDSEPLKKQYSKHVKL